ncbi:uncharacterized protein LOC125225085 isoform X1 [Leguminivora glycinivorella]|uniref:uncharacterized protein LOC125225085 isoform X1 n=1 Tax=Leguminivora glycinivorella TaxID=1035111 RepID=UPI00200D4BB7|nr:uncharacterized protein LOC125225085 isoform X1 [Leguminivora glycinivorella]
MKSRTYKYYLHVKMPSYALKTCSSVKNRFLQIKRHCSHECNDASSSDSSSSSGSGCPEGHSMYDARKYSHQLPGQDVRPPFDIPTMPSGVFRCTDGEIIGPQAGKCAYYRNPEYYCFHHMSFFDLHMVLGPSRKPQLNTGRKPTII